MIYEMICDCLRCLHGKSEPTKKSSPKCNVVGLKDGDLPRTWGLPTDGNCLDSINLAQSSYIYIYTRVPIEVIVTIVSKLVGK